MKLKTLICAGLVFAGLAMPAFAAPELVPHRGVWKDYSDDDHSHPENSVSGYVKAATTPINGSKDTYPNFIEVDVRMATIEGTNKIIVFHDKFWDRLTNYSEITDKIVTKNWAVKAFKDKQPSANDLQESYTANTDFEDLSLRRVLHSGKTEQTGQQVLILRDFIYQTACEYDVILWLDVQSYDVTEAAADVLNQYTCPTDSKHENKYLYERAYLKPFLKQTIPSSLDVEDYDAALAQAYVDHYGDKITYIWGINSGQFDHTCQNVPCTIITPAKHYLDVSSFLKSASRLPQTFGVNLSYPGTYPKDAAHLSHQNIIDTIKGLYDEWKDREDLKLISVAARPEGAFHFDARADDGNLKSKNLKSWCMPFMYHSTQGDIRFFTPDIYKHRNEHALSDGYDYIIVDGYVGENGMLGFDTSKEIKHMCGLDRHVVTTFIPTEDDDDLTSQSRAYLNLRSRNEYYAAWGVKGNDEIADAFGN